MNIDFKAYSLPYQQPGYFTGLRSINKERLDSFSGKLLITTTTLFELLMFDWGHGYGSSVVWQKAEGLHLTRICTEILIMKLFKLTCREIGKRRCVWRSNDMHARFTAIAIIRLVTSTRRILNYVHYVRSVILKAVQNSKRMCRCQIILNTCM